MTHLLRLCLGIVLLAGLLGVADAANAQAPGAIAGTIRDAETGESLPGANVAIIGAELGASADTEGTFRIKGVPPGQYAVRISFVGYQRTRRSVTVRAGQTTELNVELSKGRLVADEVVVTGSKRQEKVLDAPVQVETVSAADLEQSGGGTYLSALANLKGVDFGRVGINGQSISMRGFNNNFNTRLLQMKDGRVAQLPGTGLPQGNFLPSSELDVKRIEVVVGPASALYGPNAHTGVVNLITKGPWDESGVALDVRGGQQDLLDLNGRVAGTINDNVGWKVTGQYMTATDYQPPTGGPNAGISDSTHFFSTPFNETDLVKDYDIESIRTEASLYYRFGDGWQAEAAYGFSQNDNFGVTNNGRNRILDWQVQYQNLRLSSDQWFLQATHTSNDAGDTYQINGVATGAAGVYANALEGGASPSEARQQALAQLPVLREANRFVDKGELWDSELQYSTTLGMGTGTLDLVTGVQARRFQPDSDGTFLADAIGRDLDTDEYGGYVQLDYRPTDQFRINAAARVDEHSEYDTQFSPKAAAVYTVVPNHNVRVGYNRAFKSPTVLEGNLFIPIPVPSVAPGYVVNAVGNYTGFEVRDPDGNVVRQIPPLQPEEVNSLEVGYRGVFGDQLFVDVVAYNSWYNNFISPLTTQADGIEEIPFYADSGEPVEAPIDNAQFNALSTYINFGEAVVRGLDAGAEYRANDQLSLSASLSLIELADFEQGDADQELLLNVPNAKVKGSVTIQDVGIDNLFVSATGRWKSAYKFRSGYWRSSEFYDDGEVPSRFTANLTAGYSVPGSGLKIKASATNLFDTDTPDVLGAPETGRLLWVAATYKFQGLEF